MAKRQRMWLILALMGLTSCLSRSSTLAGHTEYGRRLHAFVISEDTDRTNLVYVNTGAESEPEVVTFENPLPSPSLCGADYEHCNAIVTSNTDESIRVVMFPLESGIALVSFDYFIPTDSLFFREQYLLPENQPNCTYIYFVDELIGYCLDPATIHAFQIRINFTDLTASTIHRRDGTFEVENVNIDSLSNLLYFVRHESDGCFSNEGSHVVFLDQGDLLDHRFADGRIVFSHNIHVDSVCSKLLRVGDMCGLAASCNGKVVLFDTRQHVEPVSFVEAEYGQIFFCPNGDFVRFEHGILSLQDKNLQQLGNQISFLFGEIRQGRCLKMADNFIFVATTDDAGTMLVNFTDVSYWHLGDSDLSTVVPARVKGDIVVVSNKSETKVYNLGLTCMPEPLVLHQSNFSLVTFFTSETMDGYQCLDRGPAPVQGVTTPAPVGVTTLPVSTTSMSDPVNNQKNSSQVIIGAVAGTLSVLVVLVTVGCVIVLRVLKPLAWIKKRMQRLPEENELAAFNPESSLPCSVQSMAIKLNDMNKPCDSMDQKSSTTGSVETTELLNNHPPTALKDRAPLLETPDKSSKSNRDGFDPQLCVYVRPETTPETTSDLAGPRLKCIEDVLKPPLIAEQVVYQNSSLLDQHGNDGSTTGSSNPRHSTSSEVTLGASSDKLPVPCTSPSRSPHHKAEYSHEESDVPQTPSELPRVSIEDPSSHGPTSTVAYQENGVPPHSSELSRVESHSCRPSSNISAEGCATAALYVQPVQEAQSNHCVPGYLLVQGLASNATLDSHDVRKLFLRMDGKMNEQGYRQHVDDVVNGDSQSQNSEPNNDNLPLDRQGSNDSQESEN